MLEVARPDLHLREKFLFQVIPLETVQPIDSQKLVNGDVIEVMTGP